MKLNEHEKGILQTALEAFQKSTGYQLIVEKGKRATKNIRHQADAFVRLKYKGNNRQYVVEVKKWLKKETLGAAIQQVKQFPQKGIIVTEYVNPNMADRLREMGIQFLDTAGNAYFNEPPIMIFIKGNKPPERFTKTQITRAFQPTGLKVLFALICNPTLINANYRDIARAANVALGTIGWVFNDLVDKGYMVKMGPKGRRLVKREKLIQRWVEAYPEKLKPKLFIARFKPVHENWWVENKDFTKNKKYEVFWGGEVAAAKLTRYLQPEFFTIYIKGNPNWLILKNKLKKDPQGTVELLKTFWKVEYKWPHTNLTPPLLIYADLLATGDARNIETANMIYEKELTRFI